MDKYTNRIGLIFLLSLCVIVEAKINIPTSDEKQILCQEIFQKMANEHFFNDKDLSSINTEIFDTLIDRLDSQKIYFTENEISSFKRKFSKFDKSIIHQKKIC